MSWLQEHLAERRRVLGLPDPAYQGPMDPVHPCRIMPTRHCPEVFGGVCGDRPCARYESDDETPWRAEL